MFARGTGQEARPSLLVFLRDVFNIICRSCVSQVVSLDSNLLSTARTDDLYHDLTARTKSHIRLLILQIARYIGCPILSFFLSMTSDWEDPSWELNAPCSRVILTIDLISPTDSWNHALRSVAKSDSFSSY